MHSEEKTESTHSVNTNQDKSHCTQERDQDKAQEWEDHNNSDYKDKKKKIITNKDATCYKSDNKDYKSLSCC